MALGDVRGGGETIVNPGALYDSSQMAITQRIIVPPFHHVVTFCSTPSAADFRVYFLGMDLVKP
jgi:hypothetical protein